MIKRGTNVAGRAGSSRLGVLFIGRVVSPLQKRLYQLSRGRLSLTGRSPVLLLTTTGRKTGKARTVPLFYLRHGERFVVCNVTPPGERLNPWPINLRANPLASVQIRGETIRCSARQATASEITKCWPALTEIWPAYQRFLDQGGQRSIFILEPVEARAHPAR